MGTHTMTHDEETTPHSSPSKSLTFGGGAYHRTRGRDTGRDAHNYIHASLHYSTKILSGAVAFSGRVTLCDKKRIERHPHSANGIRALVSSKRRCDLAMVYR